MATGPSDDVDGARHRVDRYDAAGAVGKAALRLAGQAPDHVDRERLRRHRIGVEGRIAEDVSRVVEACEPVWELLADKGLPQDLSISELRRIREAVLGRSASTATMPRVSLRFHADEVNLAAARNLIPGLDFAHRVDGYRYATWTDRDGGAVEPFVVVLSQRRPGVHAVLGAMFVGATFLRYEQDVGSFTRAQLERVERALTADLELIAETQVALRDA